MSILLLERGGDIPSTATDPVLKEVPRGREVAASPQDSAIVVTENPAASDNRYLGLLFAGQFTQTAGAEMPVRTFRETHYFRLNLEESRVAEEAQIAQVELRKGFGPVVRMYDFLDAGGSVGVLPNPSEMPYGIAFMNPALYERYLNNFRQGAPEIFPNTLADVSGSIAMRVRGFKIDAATRSLVFPPNYASLTFRSFMF